MSTLTYILGWPLLAALVLAFVPRNFRFLARIVALLATGLSLLPGLQAVHCPKPSILTNQTIWNNISATDISTTDILSKKAGQNE